MGKLPVVRDQDEAGGVLIEPSGGEQPRTDERLRQQIDHRLFRRVLRGGDHPGRFMQHNIKVFFIDDRGPVQRYGVRRRVKRELPFSNGRTVYRHAAAPQQRFRVGTGQVQLRRQEFIQSDFFHT